MAANLQLAKERGISKEDIEEINNLHLKLISLIENNVSKSFNENIKEKIHQIELYLQALWNFSQDRNYHTWAPLYEFKCKWVGRKFRCTATGVELKLENDMVVPKRFIQIGDGAIDLGTLHYSRMIGAIEEICAECGVKINDKHKMSCDTQYRIKND